MSSFGSPQPRLIFDPLDRLLDASIGQTGDFDKSPRIVGWRPVDHAQGKAHDAPHFAKSSSSDL